MKSIKIVPICVFTLLVTGCSTMEKSLKLGAVLGAAGGAVATYAAHSSTENSPNLGNVALGASIGLGAGLIAAYFTHKSVAQDRDSTPADDIEMHFGDLPPSPFIMSTPHSKKGAR